jgi:hypothetical protein
VAPGERQGLNVWPDDPSRGVRRKSIGALVKRHHFASGWETGMNNIFWIIGVVVVVLVVLGFLGLR